MVDGTTGTIGRVHLIPGLPFNLISGTKLLTLGYKLTGDENKLVYSKNNGQVVFDIKIKTSQGMLMATRLTRTATKVGGVAATVKEKQGKMVSIKEAHEKLGHMNEAETRKTASALGWTITRGTLGVCESCAVAKARQKTVKITVPKAKSETINGRVYLACLEQSMHNLQSNRCGIIGVCWWMRKPATKARVSTNRKMTCKFLHAVS